ncbi:MAG TPA: putative sugar nucleotidyl transferase, partial [Roseiflexaceae bacterium]|nr:putative sugar nucleotidyl transferase [Roseiflexaceae bacterium]
MSETIVLFEDEATRQFLPLSYTRALYDIRCGVYTLRERVAAQHGSPPQALCRAHLADVHASGRWPLGLLGTSSPITFVNGRALDLAWLPDLLAAPVNTVYIADSGQALLGGTVLLAARLTPALASAVLQALLEQQAEVALAELRRFARLVEVPARLLTFPWDMIVENGAQIGRDLVLPHAHIRWPSAAERRPEGAGLVLHRPDQIFIHPEARLDGPLVLDARDGPIVIDAAHIEPFSFIQGPVSIGRGTLIASARVRAESTIGPVCRIGGEVEASIVQGYSNKHHDGFLGHSYLGEWVNIGAMTTN